MILSKCANLLMNNGLDKGYLDNQSFKYELKVKLLHWSFRQLAINHSELLSK